MQPCFVLSYHIYFLNAEFYQSLYLPFNLFIFKGAAEAILDDESDDEFFDALGGFSR